MIQRGNNRQTTFVANTDYAFYRRCVASAIARHPCQLHAYVLMTNHVHLLLTPSANEHIANVMQSIGRRYVQYFNTRYGRTGTLWEGRYRSALVDSESYLLCCYRYIELNPVRAGLVEDPRHYRWSSYAANAFGHNDPLVTRHARFCALGTDAPSRQRSYRVLCRATLDAADLAAVREATNGGRPLGSDEFLHSVAARSNRPATPSRPRGGARPGAGRRRNSKRS